MSVFIMYIIIYSLPGINIIRVYVLNEFPKKSTRNA